MNDLEKPTTQARIFGPSFLILAALVAFALFAYDLNSMLRELLSDSVLVVFYKGSIYMLGVFLLLSMLAFVLIYEFWLNKKLTEKLNKICTKIGIYSIALALILPHVTHYFIDSYLTDKKYSICEEASHQWLYWREIAYVEDKIVCDFLIEKKKKELAELRS